MKNIYSKKLSETLQKSIADSKVVESECLPQKKTFFVRPSEDSVFNLKILLKCKFKVFMTFSDFGLQYGF